MGMMHSTSGKNGYTYYTNPYGDAVGCLIPKDKLIQIMKLEDTYRSSEEFQQKYSEKDDLAWFRDVTIEIQKRAILFSGFDEGRIEEGLKALWMARGVYAEDEEINQLTVYQRKDRSRAGNLINGSPMPNVPLQTLLGTVTDLKTYCANLKQPELPLFIISGSIT